jgi:hypothetical protein
MLEVMAGVPAFAAFGDALTLLEIDYGVFATWSVTAAEPDAQPTVDYLQVAIADLATTA